MLLNTTTEQNIDAIVDASVSQYGMLLTGRDPFAHPAIGDQGEDSIMTPTKRSFLLGKYSQQVGIQNAKQVTDAHLMHAVTTGQLQVTEGDAALMQSANERTLRALRRKADDWKKQIRDVVDEADSLWQGILAQAAVGIGATLVGAGALGVQRSGALDTLASRVQGTDEGVMGGMDTLVQTELAGHLQLGQISGVDQDEYVYKVPRIVAERYCKLLHLEDDGSYKRYRLADVLGNSNYGLPASAWDFTIGPVHPHCYCILYREVEMAADDQPEYQADPRG